MSVFIIDLQLFCVTNLWLYSQKLNDSKLSCTCLIRFDVSVIKPGMNHQVIRDGRGWKVPQFPFNVTQTSTLTREGSSRPWCRVHTQNNNLQRKTSRDKLTSHCRAGPSLAATYPACTAPPAGVKGRPGSNESLKQAVNHMWATVCTW